MSDDERVDMIGDFEREQIERLHRQNSSAPPAAETEPDDGYVTVGSYRVPKEPLRFPEAETELREQIARAIAEMRVGESWESMADAPRDALREEYRRSADAVLSGPLRGLLADRAAVERVRELADELEAEAAQQDAAGRAGNDFYLRHWANAKATAALGLRAALVRRALDGER